MPKTYATVFYFLRTEIKMSKSPNGPGLHKEARASAQEAIALLDAAKRVLIRPDTQALGAFSKACLGALSGGDLERFAVLCMAKVFVGLLPSYTIHTKGYKYEVCKERDNYEHNLLGEWQKYLKLVTRSKSAESFQAAASLLPQTVLFNKSSKLIGKVLKGAGSKRKDVRERCLGALKVIFRTDAGTRIVRILEVMNQLPQERLTRAILRSLRDINQDALTKPEIRHSGQPQSGKGKSKSKSRKISVAEDELKAVRKEVSVSSTRTRVRTWRGINERLVRVYVGVIRDRRIEKYSFVFGEILRLSVPGNLETGLYELMSRCLGDLRAAPLTPEKIVGMARCYKALHGVFGARLEFSGQVRDFESIPLEMWVYLEDEEISEVYASLRCLGKCEGSPQLLKSILRRSMYRMDLEAPETIRHLMPREGPSALLEDGGEFWEYSLLRSK